MHRSALLRIAVLLASLEAASASASAPDVQDRLAGLSLEELSNVRIISVSRREERLADAPAAIFIITSDDLRRSGATRLVEALRLAPNLQVFMATSGGHTVTARGHANSDGNKLLVLIDGRSVYSPLFSGVFWDAQDLPLDLIERIEVISGPGGTQWGTNAVNGVINVITKKAEQTQDTVLSATAGNLGSYGSARTGGRMEQGAWRAYAMGFELDNTETAAGVRIDDAWHKRQAGFRADWDTGDDDWTLQGDVYRARKGQPKPGTITISGVNLALGDEIFNGSNLMASWTRLFADGGNLSAQISYDHTQRTVPPTFAESLDIWDLQAQYALPRMGRHELSVGAGHRTARDSLTNSVYIAFLPAQERLRWSSLYAQDVITLAESLQLTLGLRAERNIYTGNEYLPNARLAWKPRADELLWTAVSRTARAPSRLDADVFIPGRPPYILEGGPRFTSETARVFELGYRRSLERVSYSINVYRAFYDHLHTAQLTPSMRSLVFTNGMMAATSGIEAWASWQAASHWRLSAGATGLHQRFWLKPGVTDYVASLAKAGHDPRNTLLLRSSLQIRDHWDLDVTFRHVGKLWAPAVPAYHTVDMRLAWRPTRALEVAMGATNLAGPAHGEFTDVLTRTNIERGYYANVISRF
jgi:iron complex outermembrane receptor protein